ncbi:MAG: hypothetical protein ACOC2R_10110, partial [Spirochaetota bacterium]
NLRPPGYEPDELPSALPCVDIDKIQKYLDLVKGQDINNDDRRDGAHGDYCNVGTADGSKYVNRIGRNTARIEVRHRPNFP